MNKRMVITTSIKVEERDDIFNTHSTTYESVQIYGYEYPNIYLNHKITHKEFNKALRTLMTFFVQNETRSLVIELDKFNDSLNSTNKLEKKHSNSG